jgi:hypothetical protein
VLIGLFERIESFFKRLESYTELPPSEVMKDMMLKIMVEVLSTLVIATKEIINNQRWRSELLLIDVDDYLFFD